MGNGVKIVDKPPEGAKTNIPVEKWEGKWYYDAATDRYKPTGIDSAQKPPEPIKPPEPSPAIETPTDVAQFATKHNIGSEQLAQETINRYKADPKAVEFQRATFSADAIRDLNRLAGLPDNTNLVSAGQDLITEAQLKQAEKKTPGQVHVLQSQGVDAYNKAIKTAFKQAQAALTVQAELQAEKQRKAKEMAKVPAPAKKEFDVAAYTAEQQRQVDFQMRLAQMPEKIQYAYKKGGVEGYNRAVKRYNDEVEAEQYKYDRAEKALEPYKNKDGTYDIEKYLRKGGKKESAQRERYLRDAGYSVEAIEDAKYYSKLGTAQKAWQEITPWDEKAGEKVSAKGGALMAAEQIVPGVYAARNWKDLGAGGKALALGIDALILVPIVGAAARGGRALASVSRAAMIGGAIKGVGREAATQALAPINMIIHPVGTAKATFKQIANIAENIAHPTKLPSVVITTTDGTVRLRIDKNLSEAKALAIRDQLMIAAKRGERPVVQIGNQTIELTQSPLMKELKGGLAHGTPMGEAFEKGVEVTYKPGLGATEQGLFMSHEPLPRFAEATARGIKGEKSVIIITSRETAEQAISSAKAYKGPKGKVAELESVLPIGARIPEPQQKLFTRIGANADKCEIWLEKPLSRTQIAKLKVKGLAETIKAIYTPAIRIKGKGAITALTPSEVDELANILKQSGNVDQARNLVRASRVVATTRVAPRLARLTGRVSPAEIRAERELLSRRPITTRATMGSRPERLDIKERIDRIERSERAERVTRAERQRRMTTSERRNIERLEERARSAEARAERQEARRDIDRINERIDRRIREDRRMERETPTRGRGRVPPPTRGRVPPPPRGRVPPPPRGRVPPPPRGRVPPPKGKRATIFTPGMSDSDKRAAIKGSSGAVCWRQGELGGKDVWHVLVYPYNDKPHHAIVMGDPPVNAAIFRGEKSAYRSVKMIEGRKLPDDDVLIDMGLQDVTLEPEGGRKVGLRFKPDPKQLTTGDFSISGKVRNITPKIPKLR